MTCFHTDEVGFRKPLLNLVFYRLENKKNCCSLNLTTHPNPIFELIGSVEHLNLDFKIVGGILFNQQNPQSK